MAEAKKTEEGTGKHPRKSTEEPYPHAERGESEKGKAEAGEEKRITGQGGVTEDLKSREYKDKEGNVHHHTRPYMEQHKAKSG